MVYITSSHIPLARTHWFVIWFHLTAKETGKQSLTICPGRRCKHGVWMAGERMADMGPGVGDRWCWKIHPWLQSGSWVSTNSPHCGPWLTQFVFIDGPFRSDCLSYPHWPLWQFPCLPSFFPLSAQRNVLSLIGVSLWGEVHANICSSVTFTPVSIGSLFFFLCLLLIISLPWGNAYSLATWVGAGREKSNFGRKTLVSISKILSYDKYKLNEGRDFVCIPQYLQNLVKGLNKYLLNK